MRGRATPEEPLGRGWRAGAGRGAAAGLALALMACSTKSKQPVGGEPPAAARADAGAAGDAGAAKGAATSAPPTLAMPRPAPPAWQRESAPVALGCADERKAKGKARKAAASKSAAAAGSAATKPGPAPASRPVARAPLLTACQEQPSAEAACDCLGKTAARWGAAFELGDGATCEKLPQHGATGQLVSVCGVASRDTLVPACALVLVARRGASWSALQVVDTSDGVDLEEQPQATPSAEALRYEELPYGGGTLFWVQTQSKLSEWSMGELEESGDASLTLCARPAGATEAAWCTSRLRLAAWDTVMTPDRDGGDDRCQVRSATALRAAMDAAGALTFTLAVGADEAGLVGRHQL